MAAREVGVPKGVGREGQRGVAGLEFAVGAGLMQEAGAEPERLAEEGERGGDIGDVEDGVAELHGASGKGLLLVERGSQLV